MKKKFLCSIVSLCLVLSAAGCGSSVPGTSTESAPQPKPRATIQKENSTQSDDSAKQIQPSDDQQQSSEQVKEPETISSETGTDTSSKTTVPVIMSSKEYFYEPANTNDYDDSVFQGYIENLYLTDESISLYPDFYKALSGDLSDIDALDRSETERIIATSKEERLAVSPKDEYPFVYTAYYDRDFYVTRLDQKYCSIMNSRSSYEGGAHGYTMYTTMNYDVATGDELKISDIIPDKTALTKELLFQLINTYSEETFFASYNDGGLEKELQTSIDIVYDPENIPDDGDFHPVFYWFLTPYGVEILFNAYDIAPFASGTIVALISYNSGIVDDAYIPDNNSTLMSEIPSYMNILTDTNDDGKVEQYMCWGNDDGNNPGDYTGLKITDQGEFNDVECYFSGYEVYVAKAEGNSFLVLDLSEDNDYHEFYCFKIDDGGTDFKNMVIFEATGKSGYYDQATEEYYEYFLTDSSNMNLSTRMDLLSSYNAMKKYRLTGSGEAISDDKYYTVNVEYDLVSTMDIETDVVDEEGNVTGKKNYPKKTSFNIIRTDGKSIVDARADDGSIARFTLETDPDSSVYDSRINGTSIDELFENLYYAG